MFDNSKKLKINLKSESVTTGAVRRFPLTHTRITIVTDRMRGKGSSNPMAGEGRYIGK